MNLKIYITTIILSLSQIVCYAQTHKLLFETRFGNFKVKLYDFTPNHRDLMLTALNDTTYQHALFNRVIQNFVVQGGEHDIDISKREEHIPIDQRKRLNAEFSKKAIHKVGALGMGRDDNTTKASFLNQIYFVVGKNVTNEELNILETKKGIKFTKKQRKIYLKHGGLPRLDNDYTVFGEIYEGLDVLLKISNVKTDKLDFPIDKVKFKISLIK